jgi:hypothetical protein
MIDSTYKLEDNNGEEVQFGDTLIGRINYYVCIGNLVKIKSNPKTYFAHCMDDDGGEIKFDIEVNQATKVATIDAWTARGLMEIQTRFAKNNNIQPMFDGYKTIVNPKKKDTEAAFDYIVKRVKDIYSQRSGHKVGHAIYFKFTFNKHPYTMDIRRHYDHNAGYYKGYELGWNTSSDIEDVKVSTHPKIVQLLKDLA